MERGSSEECVGIGDERGRRSQVCTLHRGREKMSVKEMCVGEGENEREGDVCVEGEQWQLCRQFHILGFQ